MDFTLITGASSGLGYNLAKLYSNDNCNLLLVARNLDKLNKIKEELNKPNIIIDTYKCDVSNESELENLISYINEKDYFIERLVNNAGFGDQKKLLDMDLDFQMEMIRTNSIAPFYLMKKLQNKR